MLGLGSIVVFLYLIDYAARLLRPVSIAQRVGEFGIAVIRGVYPTTTARENAGELKYATAARAASRLCGGCVRCWKT
jgi:hypothetical protein